jgi:hypothetical protein
VDLGEERPAPGDPNATGQADLRLNQGQNEVCFDISWADVDGEVFASHIHVGPAGSAGPIVVTCSPARSPVRTPPAAAPRTWTRP